MTMPDPRDEDFTLTVRTIPVETLAAGDVWVSADGTLWLIQTVKTDGAVVRGNGIEIGGDVFRGERRSLGASWHLGDRTEVV